jgi:hypothetical protein
VAAGNSVDGLRWECNEQDDLDRACTACEHKVLIRTVRERDDIAKKLKYDKRSSGGHGRCLATDVIEKGLKEGDRLEPSDEVRDIGEFQSLAVPFVATFWRRGDETLCRHRNPLWQREVGMAFEKCSTVDVLHGMHLGVLQVWARITIWFLLLAGVYGQPADAADRLANACLVVRSRLAAWAKERRVANPEEVLTMLNDFTANMVGSSGSQTLKLKGGETWTFSLFLVHQLETHLVRLGSNGHRLLMAGRCLLDIVLEMRRHGWVIPKDAIQVSKIVIYVIFD